MPKKYELIPSDKPDLFRVKALISFGNVAAGDIGGYIEKEDNLSHEGDAWVYDNAHVYDDAWVSGNAWVYGNARVSGNAWVYGNARVSGNAHVYGNARVSGNAHVYGNARVYDNAWVYGYAHVYGKARVYGYAHVHGYACAYDNARVSKVCTKTPIILCGLEFSVTITDSHMRCGCQCHTFEEWERMSYQEVGRMDPNAYDFMLKYRSVLETLINNHKAIV